MTKKKRAELRKKRRIEKALTSSKSVRDGAKVAGIPPTTFYRKRRALTKPAPSKPKGHWNRAFTDAEETVMCETILSFADLGKPCSRYDVVDIVETFIEALPAERQMKLPFIDRRPGRDFIRAFMKRHKEAIRFGRPANEAEIRWRSCNADTLTTHAASYEQILKELRIDATRLYNLDETGVSPNKDTARRRICKLVLRSNKAKESQVRVPTFRYTDRVTMLACVCADGTKASPTFVLRGDKLEFRMIDVDNKWERETLFDCLPESSFIAWREHNASIDGQNFADFAGKFVEHVKDKTADGRKVLLTYDGYRSHITLRALRILKDGGVLVYCLPAHTSGKTQPLDVGMYGPFKNFLNTEVHRAQQSRSHVEFDLFDLLHMIRRAYISAFQPPNIVKAFGKAGLWPFNTDKLLGTARPKSADEPDVMLNPKQLQDLVVEKPERLCSGDQLQPAVLHRGVVQTTQGLLVNRDDALDLIEKEAEKERRKAEEKLVKEQEALEKLEAERLKRRNEREVFERWAMERRARLYGNARVAPRPIKVRIAVAKDRIAKHRNNSR